MAIPWGAIIQGVSQMAGKAAEGRAKGRESEALLGNARDNTANSMYRTAQDAQFQNAGLDLNRQQFMEQARSGRAKDAVLGALLANIQDVNIGVPGIKTAQVSGGLRPSALGAGGRSAGELLNQQALLKMLQGDSFVDAQLLAPPQQSAMPQAGLMDKILGGIGTYGSMASGIMGAMGGGGGGETAAPQSASSQSAIQENLRRAIQGGF